ncbi:hypothetical protein [Pontibacter mangrovi]|uniref:Calcineurin-like phosphoesterase domain-containing protein n=1 Tax=Pontibacter mangrovi TaxID=2589816 RepID=A0A501VXM1_9BACT|nr:hypothetical protein [Pontibacter mangrovi]TPE42473.1 hypothetical protein FJM65_17875 [Pontibacter mangrovi]
MAELHRRCRGRLEPHLITISGNHDWYDGLSSVLKQFCQERSIGGWTTRQERYEKLAFFRKHCLESITYSVKREGACLETRRRSLELVLALAGDLHHYARHNHVTEGSPDTPYLTAGGGGTFLHPTHHLKEALTWPDKHSGKNERFVLEECFPPRRVFRGFTFRNLLFPLKNPYFSLLLGLVYLLMGWQLYSDHARLWEKWPGTHG